MGNEQGSPYLQQKQQQTSPNSGTNSPYDFESLIVVRGERRTGKTTLVSRMKGQNFNPTYTPTPGLQVFQFPWKLNSSHCNNVMISVWDVVEHSLQSTSPTNSATTSSNTTSGHPEPSAQNKQLPDAQTIDTLKRANGLVILIDSRNESSIQLAENLICEAPEECQIVVFSNFCGEKNVSPAIPKRLLSHIGRFSFIPGNLKTNLGLLSLSKWLQLPLLSAKRKMFADLFHAADEDLHTLEHNFLSEAKEYSTVESAVLKMQKPKSTMQSYSYLDANKQMSNQADNLGSNILPSNSNPSEIPSSLERPSVFAEPIQRKRKPMPFYNNTGSSQAASNSNAINTDYENMQDDGFWSDDDNSDLNGRFDEPPSPEKKVLKPNPMVQAAQPKKTMKQVIEENTVRRPINQVSADEEVKNVEQKTKKRKKKVNHGLTQKVEQSNQIEGDVNDKFFSDDENVLNATENGQNLTKKEESNPTLNQPNLETNKTTVTTAKPKTVFTTTLVVEEEDEEDEIEPVTVNQTENKPVENIQSNIEKSDTITANDDNKNAQNQQKDDGDFWSENDEVDEVEQAPIKSDSDDDDLAVKPNPLVQKVKPRTNNYKNVVPQTTETVRPESNASQTVPIKQDTQNQQQRPNDNGQSHITSPIQTVTTQNQVAQQPRQSPAQSNADSDDDFWNFDSTANQQAAAAAIQLKRQQNQQTQQPHQVSRQKRKAEAQPASRPLVIPKSQVNQRTITVASKGPSSEKQKSESVNLQNPLIPTTDLFSDLPESKDSDFFGQTAQSQRQLAQQQPIQKVDDTSKTKNVRKRKRVVKSSTNKNEQQSVAGYDAV